MVDTRDLVVAESCLSPASGGPFLSACGLHLQGGLGQGLLSHRFPYPFPATLLTLTPML